jgi:hypothetical protein
LRSARQEGDSASPRMGGWGSDSGRTGRAHDTGIGGDSSAAAADPKNSALGVSANMLAKKVWRSTARGEVALSAPGSKVTARALEETPQVSALQYQ